MKTRAELIRNAKSGEFTFELIERFGGREIYENMKGKRTVGKVQTNGFYLVNNEGEKSFLNIPKASLIEYDGDELRVFNYGFRAMSDEEKAVMDEWKKITETDDFKRREVADMLSDGSSTYWQKKIFFEKKNMLYLTGSKDKGMELDFCKHADGEEKCIRDEKVKGDVILVYKVERKGGQQ